MRLGYFPGESARASLKPVVTVTVDVERWNFPGESARASLKPRQSGRVS